MRITEQHYTKLLYISAFFAVFLMHKALDINVVILYGLESVMN